MAISESHNWLAVEKTPHDMTLIMESCFKVYVHFAKTWGTAVSHCSIHFVIPHSY